MGKTIRRQALDRINKVGSLDDFDFSDCERLMEDDELKARAKEQRFRKFKKVKLVDRRHGFIETTDGAWKEQKICKILGRQFDEGSWTQKGKKDLKWKKHRKERQWNPSDENED